MSIALSKIRENFPFGNVNVVNNELIVEMGPQDIKQLFLMQAQKNPKQMIPIFDVEIQNNKLIVKVRVM